MLCFVLKNSVFFFFKVFFWGGMFGYNTVSSFLFREQHRMRYLPSAHDDTSAIYQEVNDYPQVSHSSGAV